MTQYNQNAIDQMAEKMLDGKAIALVVKEDGLAMLTVYNIYSYDLEKFIKEINKNRLLPKMLAHDFWSTKLVPVEAYRHIIEQKPQNIQERLNTVKPSDFLMEFRVFYRSAI